MNKRHTGSGGHSAGLTFEISAEGTTSMAAEAKKSIQRLEISCESISFP